LALFMLAPLLIGCVSSTGGGDRPGVSVAVVDARGSLVGSLVIEVDVAGIRVPVALYLDTKASEDGAAAGAIGVEALGQRFACTLEAGSKPACALVAPTPRATPTVETVPRE
jgi:hypothetical protein